MIDSSDPSVKLDPKGVGARVDSGPDIDLDILLELKKLLGMGGIVENCLFARY